MPIFRNCLICLLSNCYFQRADSETLEQACGEGFKGGCGILLGNIASGKSFTGLSLLHATLEKSSSP